jgi:ABC-type multidrug transport system ATPase subunit
LIAPLAGLDSTTAVTVIEALKGIAVNRNSTLIVTIHQPSARLYGLFDKCLFLSGMWKVAEA